MDNSPTTINSLIEPEPEIVIDIDTHFGITISIDPSGMQYWFMKVADFLAEFEGDVPISDFAAWAKAIKLPPLYIKMAPIWYYGVPVSLSLFDLWVDCAVRYLGKEEGLKYIEEEPGCSIEKATKEDRLSIFAQKTS